MPTGRKSQDFYLLLTNQPGKDSWPITGATFILMHKQQSKPEVAREAINFFDWAYRNGDQLAEQLDYVPMPDSVVKMVEQSWQQIKGPGRKAGVERTPVIDAVPTDLAAEAGDDAKPRMVRGR